MTRGELVFATILGILLGAIVGGSTASSYQVSKWATEKDSITSENLHLWSELRTCEITRVEDLREMNAKITQMQAYYWTGRDSGGKDLP